MHGDEVLRRLKRQAWVQAFMAGFLLVLAVSSSAVLAIFAMNAQGEAEKQRQQVVYLCSVARVLDSPIQRAARTTQDNVLRQQFRSAHIVLSQTEPCREVEG